MLGSPTCRRAPTVLRARVLGRVDLPHLQLLAAIAIAIDIADHGTLERAVEPVGMSRPAGRGRRAQQVVEGPVRSCGHEQNSHISRTDREYASAACRDVR